MSSKAVFLDRDGTVIRDPGYLADPAGVELMPGAADALRALAEGGYRLVVVTNQSGVARGLLTEETLQAVHDELRRRLAAAGVRLDGVYYCPYHPEAPIERYAVDSDLRKPRPGMLLQAARELDLDLPVSWMIGDSGRDVEAGQRAGCRTVRLPAGGPDSPGGDVQADYTAPDLPAAARLILDAPPRRDTPPTTGD